MIDIGISASEGYSKDLILLTKILLWVTGYLDSDENKEKAVIGGYFVYHDFKYNFSKAILLCEGKSEKILYKFLQQPPGEFKGKYVAYVVADEDNSVKRLSPGGIIREAGSCPDMSIIKESEGEEEEEGMVPLEISET